MTDLWVRQHVLDRLSALRGRPWEVGGWLLGYRARNSIVVTHATAPASRGTPFGVTISGQGHRPAFDRLWDATGGRVTFLGDWHTHPGGAAHPSTRDETAVADIANDDDFKTPEPLIGIVATPRLPRRAANVIEFFEGNSAGSLIRLAASAFVELPPLVPSPSRSGLTSRLLRSRQGGS